jgi:hypothetical protein
VGNFLIQKPVKAGGEMLLICTAVKATFGKKDIWLLSPLGAKVIAKSPTKGALSVFSAAGRTEGI